MGKLDEQKKVLVDLLRQGSAPEQEFAIALSEDLFVTQMNGAPLSFGEMQNILRQMQRPEDAAASIDGVYCGYEAQAYSVTLRPGGQIRAAIQPQKNVPAAMRLYDRFVVQLRMTLAARGLKVWDTGYHPARRAEQLPLAPVERWEALDRYFRSVGSAGTKLLRASAATGIAFGYAGEQDFVNKMRAACLLAPLLALLTDHALRYEGNRNNAFCMRMALTQEADPDRFGVPPHLMDPDFGYDRYAETVLTRPLVTALHGSRIKAVGRKTAQDVYGSRLSRREAEHILSMFFFDARPGGGIELRCADSLPPQYMAAYAQTVRTIFGSRAALQNVLRHYAGMTTGDIANAEMAVCKDGHNAWVYGRPVGQELAWLLIQARSRTSTAEERALLNPFARLAATKKTPREEMDGCAVPARPGKVSGA